MMKRSGGQRGSAAVEGALVLLVFVMLFLGLMDVSRMMYAHNEMPYLAREGARYAAVHGSGSSNPMTCGQVITHVRGIAPGVDPSLLTINVNGQTSSRSSTALGSAPGTATVTASYTLNPIFKKILGSSITVSGKSSMAYAQ